ncbi:MAG TPA: RNA polymerase sigma factor [Intrasporangium sp.]|uniref:RNA polymerase sigma factor n=1 Tax=Intrasporangium sp. TaxID=1925024 RepID=UPI002B47CC3F|nr:RNA polymerase sigma factor [Intrasporangium sp.]HKX66958.1 RNA polymerase sigma factor [Intrasporangium sp.]
MGGAIEKDRESEILARVRAGERAAYAELVVTHAPLAKRVAVLAGAGRDADDVVQEAFVKAYRSLTSQATFRDGSSFRPWLLRIVVNETHNQRRGSGRRAERERRAGWLDARSLTVPDPAESALSAARRRALLDAVSGLPADQRDVVTCRYLLELSEAETSQVLDLPAGTVKSRLHRALSALKEVMADA